MAEALALLHLCPEKGLYSFIRAVNSLPVLSVNEERKLARRYRKHNDLDAARQLVMSNLRYIVRVACGFSGYDLPQTGLIQGATSA